MDSFLGTLFAILAAISWGASAIFAKTSMRKMEPLQTTFVSLSLGTVIILAFTIVTTPVVFAYFPELFIVAFTFMSGYVFYYIAVHRLGVVRSQPLTSSLRPVTAAVFAFFILQEVLTFAVAIGTVLIILGLYLVSPKQASAKLKVKIGSGVLIAVMASVMWGLGGAFVRSSLLQGVPTYTVFFTSVVLGLAMLFGFIVAKDKGRIRETMKPERRDIPHLVAAGITQIAGYLFLYLSLIYTQVIVAYPISNTSTFFSVALAVLFLREKISLSLIAGTMAVFLGTLLVAL